MISSNCLVCGSKRSRFIKGKEANGLLSSLGKGTPLCQIALVGPLLFQRYKMNNWR